MTLRQSNQASLNNPPTPGNLSVCLPVSGYMYGLFYNTVNSLRVFTSKHIYENGF